MGKRPSAGEPGGITPKDVFDRSNMPSWWERLTGVAPKIPEDRTFLAFVAARYGGEPRLPHPDALASPDELRRAQHASSFSGWACLASVALLAIGLATQQSALAFVGIAGLVVSVAARVGIGIAMAPALAEFAELKARCAAAHARVSGESLDPQDRSTLNDMIDCDEGTLAYCAAKIASEITRDPAWKAARLQVVAVNLWTELAEIGLSAGQIAEDRESTETLRLGRLHNDAEVQEMIDADNQARAEAMALLAARVSAFADYRDRVHRVGMSALREGRTVSRAMRQAADELAVDRSR